MNSEIVIKLFKALVSSTAMYAATIWSLRYMKKIEKIQNILFRKLLLMPNNRPGYVIRTEIGIESMQVTIFRVLLNFIKRILEMQEERIPKICLKKLIELANRTYNWVNQIKKYFLEKIGKIDLFNNLTLESFLKEKENLIKEFESYSKKEDILSIETSTSLTVYPWLFKINPNNNYLNLKIPINDKKILAQLRVLNIYNRRVLTKKKIYTLNEDDYCEYCAEKNSILHSIIDCEKYSDYRVKINTRNSKQ